MFRKVTDGPGAIIPQPLILSKSHTILVWLHKDWWKSAYVLCIKGQFSLVLV